MPVRIGLFGGTFDPPHVGHLIVAQDARYRLSLDRVVFVPAAQPPHKTDTPITAAAVRLAMVEAAIADDPRFEVDDLELNRTGPSYTVDTLRVYRSRHPADELFLLLGADQHAELDEWHEAATLPSLAQLAVLTRGGSGRSVAAPDVVQDAIEVEVTRVDVSSTEVRRRVRAGEPIRYLVPAAVETLIRRHGLYAREGADRRARAGVTSEMP